MRTLIFPSLFGLAALALACGDSGGGTASTQASDATATDTATASEASGDPGASSDPATSETGDTDATAGSTGSSTGSTSDASTGSTSDGTTGACEGPECGACPPECEPDDKCVDGQWQCSCICPETTDPTDPTTTTDPTTDTGGGEVDCSGANEISFPTFDKSCASAADCVVVIHQVDCCGNTVAWGINEDEQMAFDEAESLCQSQYPGCGCPAGPTEAEDGDTTWDHNEIMVDCAMGMCTSFIP